MTREEAKRRIECCRNFLANNYSDMGEPNFTAFNMAIKALEQEPCEIIKEIPKDYKYDTETEDFLVYRHMYTGREIHIEKPVPRYRLEQEPCKEAISRSDMLDAVGHGTTYTSEDLQRIIKGMPPVNAQPKTGHWIFKKTIFDKFGNTVECSSCHKKWKTYDEIRWREENKYCPNCGAKMVEPQESEEV